MTEVMSVRRLLSAGNASGHMGTECDRSCHFWLVRLKSLGSSGRFAKPLTGAGWGLEMLTRWSESRCGARRGRQRTRLQTGRRVATGFLHIHRTA